MPIYCHSAVLALQKTKCLPQIVLKISGHYVTRISWSRLVIGPPLPLPSLPPVDGPGLFSCLLSSASVPDVELQGTGLRRSPQPQSRWCAPLPTSSTPGDNAATRFLPQLHLWAPRCISKHKDACRCQSLPSFALPSQTFLLWPQVYQLPLPGHVRRWTLSGIHTLSTSSPVCTYTCTVGCQQMNVSVFSVWWWWQWGMYRLQNAKKPSLIS